MVTGVALPELEDPAVDLVVVREDAEMLDALKRRTLDVDASVAVLAAALRARAGSWPETS